MSLSLQTQQRLSDLFTTLYEGERQAEIMRQVLVEQTDFSPVGLFIHLSQGKEVISINDLHAFLNYHQVQYTSEELNQVMNTYSSNAEQLTYNNFLNIILPSLAASLRNIKTGKSKSNQKINHHIQCALSKVLQQEIELTREVEQIKDDLIPRWDFSEEAAFSLLESYTTKGQNKIDYMALKRFFNQLNQSVTEDDLLYLLRRADKDKDSKISKSDFAHIMFSSKHHQPHQQQQQKQSQKLSRPNSQRASGNKIQTQFPQPIPIPIPILSNSKINSQRTQPSPSNTSNRIRVFRQRNSTDQLFQKIGRLTIQSPTITKIDRINRSSDQSFTGRSVSPFDPLSSSKKISIRKNHSPKQQNQLIQQNEETNNVKIAVPETQYKYFGVDSRVINEDTAELVNFFIQFIEQFQLVDQSRCQIVQFPDFNLQSIWNLFCQPDSNGAKVITIKHFEIISRQILGANFNQDQLKFLYQLLDLDRDNVLNYDEFLSIFQPTSEYYANIMFNQAPSDSNISGETLEAVKILIDQMIEMQQGFHKNKQMFFQKKRYSLLSLFEHLNYTKNGYLSVEDFMSLFQRFGYNVTQSELNQIICKFTRDKQVQRVTMRQFLNELTPNH